MSDRSVQVFEYLLALKNIMVPAVRQLEPDQVDNYMELPFSDSEMIELYGLLENITKEDVDQLSQQRPSLESLPSTEEIIRLHARMGELEDGNITHQEIIKGWTFTNIAHSKAPHALQVIDKAVASLVLLSDGWLAKLLKDIVYGENRVNYWQRLISDCKAKILGIRDIEQRIAEFSFGIPENSDLRQVKADAELLRSELAGNGRPSFMFKMFSGKGTLYLLEQFTINNASLRTADDLELLLHYIRNIEAKTHLILRWNHSISIVNGPLLTGPDDSMLQNIEKSMELIQVAFKWRTENIPALIEIAQESTPDGPHEWTNMAWLNNFAQGIISRGHLLEYNLQCQEFENFSRVLKNGAGGENPHASWGILYEAYRRGDGAKWQETLLQLHNLHSIESKVCEMLDLQQQLNDQE